MMLVTLEEAKANMFVTFDNQDDDIRLKIRAASGAILNYLKNRTKLYQVEYTSDGEPELDSNGKPVYVTDSNGARLVRDEIKQATLILVGIMFRDRDGSEAKNWEHGYLPFPVTALIWQLRDPSLA